MKNLIHLFLILYFFLMFSCDEFMLKKTVGVKFLRGEITFDPSLPCISGVLNYTIKNKQKKVFRKYTSYLTRRFRLIL